MTLSDVQIVFYNIYKRLMMLEEFETWLYENIESECIIGKGLYLDLISINYRGECAIEEVDKLILPYVDFAKGENIRINHLLNSIIDDEGDFYQIMSQLYADYCHGYNFLRYLALSFAVSGSEEQIGKDGIRKNLLKVNQKYKREAARLVTFFKNGELIITKEFEYKDSRKEDDKIEFYKINEMLNS